MLALILHVLRFLVVVSIPVAPAGGAVQQSIDDMEPQSAQSLRTAIATEVVKLAPSDGAAGDLFGYSVSVSGDTALVGVRLDDHAGGDAGSAYVFERNHGGREAWGMVVQFTASDAGAGDLFGRSVCIWGDTAVVGAPSDDHPGKDKAGSVYVFERDRGDPDAWKQVAKRIASDATYRDHFGTAVAVCGDTLVVGARDDDVAGIKDAGSAYVFERDQGGVGAWGQVVKLTAGDAAAGDMFGRSVDISGDTAVVGAWLDDNEDNPDAGAVYVFGRNQGGPGAWGEVAKLTPRDATEGDGFGFSAAISGDTVVVGAPMDNHAGGIEVGSSYVFERNQGAWAEVAKLTASDPSAGDQFGYSVSLSADLVVIGATRDDHAGRENAGSAYVFERNQGGPSAWGQVVQLTASEAAPGDRLGLSVAVSGGAAVVGAPMDRVSGIDSGLAYVFVDFFLGHRMRGYEARRNALSHFLSRGELGHTQDLHRHSEEEIAPGRALEAAVELREQVTADEAAPAWYLAEIAELGAALQTLESLEPGERERVTEALRFSPWPLRGDTFGDLERAAETIACALGENHPEVGDRYYFISQIQGDLGRWDDAIETARHMLELAQSLPGERQLQVALRRAWLGQRLHSAGSLAQAEVEIRAANETLERLDLRRFGVYFEQRLVVASFFGAWLLDAGHLEEGEGVVREFVVDSRALGETSEMHLYALGSLAVLLGNRGDIASATVLQERAVSLRLQALGADRDGVRRTLQANVGAAWFNLGLVYTDGGRFIEAEDAFLRALEALEPIPTDRSWVTITKSHLAAAVHRTGDPERAIELAEEAAREAESTMAESPRERAANLERLISRLVAAREFERAAEVLDRYDELRRERGFEDPRGNAHSSFFHAVVTESRGELREARSAYEDALTAFERAEGMHAPTGFYAGLARCCVLQDDLEAAHAASIRAVEGFEQDRAKLERGIGRSRFRESPYPGLADVELRRGQQREAWEAIESWRARSLYELLTTEAPRLAERAGLEGELSSIDAQLEALQAEGGEEDEIEGRTTELYARRFDLRSRLGAGSIGEARSPLPLERVQAVLAPDEAFIGWFEVERRGRWHSYAWVIRHDSGPHWVELGERPDGSEASFSSRLSAFAKRLALEAKSPFAPRPESVAPAARALGAELLGTVLERGWLEGAAHLVVAASEFDGFPVEALQLDGDLVAERWTLSYAPSCTIHALLHERPRRQREWREVLVLGDPPFRAEHLEEEIDFELPERAAPLLRSSRSLADFDRLPRSRDEALAVAAEFPGARVLMGLAASERALERLASLDELTRFSVVHLASHAIVDAAVPSRSGVVLSQIGLPDAYEAALRGESVPDGFLSAREVAATWRLDAELVTLSACSTALGEPVSGEGYVGLATAFLQAGARSLLVSLWDVSDEATMLFMQSFYHHWGDGDPGPRPKAEALRRARRDLREYSRDGKTHPYAHPAFWAAFVLVGDPR